MLVHTPVGPYSECTACAYQLFQGTQSDFSVLAREWLHYTGPVDLTQYYVSDYTISDNVPTQESELSVQARLSDVHIMPTYILLRYY
jgi:hypothetical protein